MNTGMNKFKAAAMLAGIILIGARAWAVGTPAGTVIQSRSQVDYTSASGSVHGTVYSNVVQLTVAQLAAVNITPLSSSLSTTGVGVEADYALTVTNSGNGSDRFTLSGVSSKGWTCRFYVDADGDGVLQPAELSAGAITQTASIAADGTSKIIARVSVPNDASLNGQSDLTTVTAASAFDNAKTNSAALNTSVNAVIFSNAATGLTISTVSPTPGQNVTYTFTITNSGSAAATAVTFTDPLLVSLFSYGGQTSSPSVPFTLTGNTASWNIGTIAAGASQSVTITLQVLPGAAAGTVLSNQITVQYTAGGNTYSVTSNNPYAAVAGTGGVSITPPAMSSSKEPEDTLVHAMTVKNEGTIKDVLELSYASAHGRVWTFYKDVNGDGLLDAGDTPLTDRTGSPAGVDVDSVAAGASVKILARQVVPQAVSDQFQDVTSFTVRSAADAGKFQTATATDTTNIPVIVLNKTVAPSGDQPPGQAMTYTVTYRNMGHGKAYNFTLTEDEPAHMTYIANSVTVNGTAKTDSADTDNVTVTTVAGKKVVTITFGTMDALSAQGTVQYRASIQ
jgi:uncharacterized repeat protein (TIGR01451 family)